MGLIKNSIDTRISMMESFFCIWLQYYRGAWNKGNKISWHSTITGKKVYFCVFGYKLRKANRTRPSTKKRYLLVSGYSTAIVYGT